ncbi:hypothetical protein PMIN01_09927 [Paraphaeosphaeria minitans]|uniref:Uncharacterized protein n=1 Tax=Paraphaeosphaeria minitans TaxID=565426 RepID=A0A9P6GBD5_9PLEO|nr:hypothetical protein PMIN01_09927 [Paraphaeosphaeria minitans]
MQTTIAIDESIRPTTYLPTYLHHALSHPRPVNLSSRFKLVSLRPAVLAYSTHTPASLLHAPSRTHATAPPRAAGRISPPASHVPIPPRPVPEPRTSARTRTNS